MADITDEFMRQMLAQTRTYTAVLLRRTDRYGPDSDAIVWEHGRRNFSMRADGLLSIVCSIRDDSDLAGIGIFNATPEEVTALMEDDPGVQSGIFRYEVHPVRSFPGDALPA